MGMERSVSLRPYIEVSSNKENKKVIETKICLKCPNKKFKNENFCPDCGSYIIIDKKIETEILTPVKVFLNKNFDDSLYCGFASNENIFIPNKKVPDSIVIDDYCDIIDLTQSNQLMQLQMDWMKKTYKKQIDFLISEFGVDSVHVKWGLISFWS